MILLQGTILKLNKNICKRCINTTKLTPEGIIVSWNDVDGEEKYDDRIWRKGYVFCPGLSESILKNSVINCPYSLEHVVTEEDSIFKGGVMKKILVWRVVVTIVIIITAFIFTGFYERISGPLEGSVAVAQLEDSDVIYVSSRSVANGDVEHLVIVGGAIVPLLFIWGTFCYGLYGLYKKEEKENV